MKRIIRVTFCIIIILSNSLLGQHKNNNTVKEYKTELTGNLNLDLICQFNKINGEENSYSQKKYSPLLAGVYSAIIPGGGQFYTNRYWESATFLGVEILSWIAYAVYLKKGDDQTKYFQNYADNHWSVVRYVRWIEDNCATYYGFSASGILIGNPSSDIQQPWKYVDWNLLNYYEERIGGVQHSGFSHKLAPYGDQQYYEMIGKYAQFGSGWDDAINFTDIDIKKENVSPKFLKYSGMRGEANNFYNIATTVSYVIVANHIFSALEAAWNASKLNRRLQLEGHILPRIIYGNIVEYVPTLNAKYEF